ncbi:UNVERIFIED_CONTAM: hypothetical protein HDU68_005998 [Siphonaria sp. JEL0065]|nr:hypothetical protein HDU68_005998 [Siphonaria sp. JEL0065]
MTSSTERVSPTKALSDADAASLSVPVAGFVNANGNPTVAESTNKNQTENQPQTTESATKDERESTRELQPDECESSALAHIAVAAESALEPRAPPASASTTATATTTTPANDSASNLNCNNNSELEESAGLLLTNLT